MGLSKQPKIERRKTGPRLLLGLLLGCLLFWSAHQGLALVQAARQPIDGVLVLGGSIRREIYAAQLAQQFPERPILISAGSAEPCIWLIFRRSHAPMEQVWIEPCAQSTLGNYRFSTATLNAWGVRHLQLVTSGSHTARAVGLGRIILGGQGIWVSPVQVAETGRPGNRESWIKTGLDWLRGFGWMVVSQVYQPRCLGLHRLSEMDLKTWQTQAFECEAQGQVDVPAAWRSEQSSEQSFEKSLKHNFLPPQF